MARKLLAKQGDLKQRTHDPKTTVFKGDIALKTFLKFLIKFDKTSRVYVYWHSSFEYAIFSLLQ